MNAMTSIERALEDGISVERFSFPDAAAELERTASTHRRAIATFGQRIANTRKERQQQELRLADEMRAEILRHQAALAAIKDELGRVVGQAAASIAADQRLVDASTAALEALQA